jgi:hypothetical protein
VRERSHDARRAAERFAFEYLRTDMAMVAAERDIVKRKRLFDYLFSRAGRYRRAEFAVDLAGPHRGESMRIYARRKTEQYFLFFAESAADAVERKKLFFAVDDEPAHAFVYAVFYISVGFIIAVKT